jgi:hypothetical protein
MDQPMLIGLGHVEVYEFRILAEQGAHFAHVASFDCCKQALERNAIDMSAELRPAIETMLARDHELGVMKLERRSSDRRGIGVLPILRVMPPQTDERFRLGLLQFPGEFLGQDLELAQAGLRGERLGRWGRFGRFRL